MSAPDGWKCPCDMCKPYPPGKGFHGYVETWTTETLSMLVKCPDWAIYFDLADAIKAGSTTTV